MEISIGRKIQVWLFAWIGLYSYLIDVRYDQYYILLLFFLSIFVCAKNWHSIRVRLDKYVVAWMGYFFVCGFTIFLAADVINSLKGWLIGLLIILVGFMCRQEQDEWERYLLKVLYVFSGCIVLSIYCQFALPDFVENVQRSILNEEQLLSVSKSFLVHAYAGITGQVGTAGYACFVFIAISVAMLLYKWTSYTRKYWMLSTIVGLGAMILTGKRGLLGACFVAILFSGYLFWKYYRKNLFVFWLLLIFGLLVTGCAFLFVEAFSNMGDRIVSMSLSGREDIWEVMWQGFLDHPILGNGLGNVHIYEITAHNEYLRSLYETGIVGTVAYLAALCSNFMPCLRTLRQSFDKSQLTFDECVVVFSFFVQIVHFVYAMSGNPLSANDQFLIFSVISSVGLKYSKHKKSRLEEIN